MNNSAFSYVYRNIKGTTKDSFEEAGSLGQLISSNYPTELTIFFADEKMTVKCLKAFLREFDHYPIIHNIIRMNSSLCIVLGF
jgi:hypothetical protein